MVGVKRSGGAVPFAKAMLMVSQMYVRCDDFEYDRFHDFDYWG